MKAKNKSVREFLGVWVSPELARKLDQTVEDMDLDRSKFLRHAVNEKLERQRNPGELQEQAA